MSKNQENMDGSPPIINERFVQIGFQLGPIKEVGVNGTTIEHIIDLLVNRLEGFQRGPFACQHNSDAMAHLLKAKIRLLERTLERHERGVEGTNQL